MSRTIRALALPVLMWMGSIWMMPAVVHAEMPPAAVPKVDDALRQLDILARQSRLHGTLPRLSDPAAANVLLFVWDGDALLGNGPYTSADVPLIIDLFDKESQVLKTYALFSADPAVLPDTAHNTALFQDEIVRSAAMLVRTSAAALSAMEDFVGRMKPGEMTDVRRQGLDQARLGLQQMVSSAVLMLRSPGLTPQNQAIITTALAGSAKPIAHAINANDRAAMAATVRTAQSALGADARASLDIFAKAMADSRCEGLCMID